MSEGLRLRKTVPKVTTEDKNESVESDSNEESDFKEKNYKFTLMEEVLLVGLIDQEGYTSFWNDSISTGLRGCILIELALRDRIELSQPARLSINRPINVKSSSPTGDGLLDEALRVISDKLKSCTVSNAISYLSGESWNVFYMNCQLQNVRERIAKSLVDKGVLSTEMKNFILFDMTTHPLKNPNVKAEIIDKINDILIRRWNNDVDKMDIRNIAIVLLCNFSDVLDNALSSLPDADYEIARNRLFKLSSLDFSTMASRGQKSDIFWAIFAAFK